MRTRKGDTLKSPTAKKTPPSRKSASKTPPTPPESAAESATPKTAESTRVYTSKAKQVKSNETTPTQSTVSDPNPEPSPGSVLISNYFIEEAKASTGAEVTPGRKGGIATKSAVKRMPGRPKTKGVVSRTPKSGEVDKVNVEESSKKDDVECMEKEEPVVENVGESLKKEETVMEVEELVVEKVGESTKKEETTMEVEEPVVENVGEKKETPREMEEPVVVLVGESAVKEQITVEVQEPIVENIGGAKKEHSTTEVQVNPIANVGDSLRQEENVVEEDRKFSENEEPNGAKEVEEVSEKQEEEIKGVGDKEEPNIELVNMEENVKNELQREDAQPLKEEYGGDEGMEDYGDRLDLGEHGEDEMEDDPEELIEDTDALEEERRELTAIAKERKIKKEHEIFVGGLDRDATEEDVKKVFENIGEVVEVRLHKNLSTNKNKGYAFVKFANKEQAKRALSEMKNPVIHGKRCGTAPSEDNDTLFLGNICNTWTKEAIKQKLKDYGVEGVENITLVPDVQHEGLSRGFAFLEFSCHPDAMLAYKRLQKPDVIFGHPERTAKVAFAEPIREPDPEIMAQVKTVFLDGVPHHWSEDSVRELFKGYGEIVRIVLARNMSTAKRKDFGFVDFSTHEAAVACIDGINSAELGDGKMKVKARLSNPLPKTQAVKGGMCGGFRIGRGGGGAFSNFGRGFGRGGHTFNRPNFQRNRGFYQGGYGQTGRMGFPNEYNFNNPYAEFRGRQNIGRGGRRGSLRGGRFAYGGGFAAPSRPNPDGPWHGAPDRGRGMHAPSRRQPYSPDGRYERPFVGRHFDEPYVYNDNAHGIKRPFYMTDHDPEYMEPARHRQRLDYNDPATSFHANRYRDTYGDGSSPYPRDYYGPDYGGGPYSSFYGSDRSYGGGYYY